MTINSIDSNIPIEISKGGTNASSMAITDGVVYFDGTRLVTSNVGTSNQLLTAVTPTFTTSPRPGLIYLSSQTASNSASIDFTSVITSSYSSYLLVFYNVRPTSTGNSVLSMRVSTDNGSTFLAGTSYFAGNTYNNILSGNSWSLNDVGGGGQWNMSYFVINQVGEVVPQNGTIYLTNMASASVYPNVFGMLAFDDYNVNFNWYSFCGNYSSTINANAIRLFYPVGGNISQGVFTLYGLVES